MVRKNLLFALGILLLLVLIGSVESVEVCCEETKSGELCARIDQSECAPGSRNTPNLCSDPNDPTIGPSWCQLGVCYDPEEGLCTRGVPSPSCLADGGDWDAVWNETLCNPGCCLLGRNTEYMSPKLCENLAKSEGFPFEFNRGISREACRGYTLDEGACLYEDDVCIFKTEKDCIGPGGSGGIDFRKNIFCSKLGLVNYTNHSKKICDKGDVYWVDNKGNKEELYDACDDRTESCDADVNGNAYCKSANCVYNGTVRKNGESWCVYEAYVGEGKDVVGSKHLLMNCEKGNIKTTSCGADYRYSICAEKTDQWGTTAQCRVNKLKNCFAAEDEDACKLADDCDWKEVDMTKEAEDTFRFEICAPKYPKGFDFSSLDTENNGKDVCGLGTVYCDITYRQKNFVGIQGKKKCISNCDCREKIFVEEMNNLCVSLGDCGAYINYLGEGTDNYKIEGNNVLAGVSACENYNSCQFECKGNYDECPAGYDECKKTRDYVGGGAGDENDYFVGCNGDIPQGVGFEYLEDLTNDCPSVGSCVDRDGVMVFEKKEQIWKKYISYLIKPNTASNIPVWLGTNNLGNIVSEIVKASFENIKNLVKTTYKHKSPAIGNKITIQRTTFTCLPWKPPYGGADCEKCDDDSLKPCSPYRCSSLGTSCKFIPIKNYEENNPLGVCINYYRNDSKYPELTLDKISQGYSFNTISSNPVLLGEIKTSGGDCVEERSSIELSFKTDEEAECRWSPSEIGRIEDWSNDMQGMESFEEDYAFATIHNITLSIPEGNTFRMHIKCIDPAGNWNTADHTVDVCISPQPRRTPPIILTHKYSPPYGSYLPYGQTYTEMTLYTDEPAECRYGNGPGVAFDAMAQNMICNTPEEGEYNGEWFCATNLSGLNQPENRIYIRCNDSRGNVHTDDKEYMLRLTQNPLRITQISLQNGTVRETKVTKENPLFLNVNTAGGADGDKSKCRYSFIEEGFSDFFDNEEFIVQHKYRFNFMPDGTHTIKITCEDSVRNKAEATILFTMDTDEEAPVIINKTLQGTTMKLTTDEPAECVYKTTSCNYLYESAASNDISFGRTTTHEINDFNKRLDYYIRCRDEFTNENCTTIEATEQRESNPPEVVRIFYDEKVSRKLKLITNEPAQCSFEKATCSFEVDAGEEMSRLGNKEYSTEHYAPWDLNTKYHIKCIDSWGNPNVGCLIVVEPFRIINLEG